jgi:hypothetical protein
LDWLKSNCFFAKKATVFLLQSGYLGAKKATINSFWGCLRKHFRKNMMEIF